MSLRVNEEMLNAEEAETVEAAETEETAAVAETEETAAPAETEAEIAATETAEETAAAAETSRCASCGAEIADGAKFCTLCGAATGAAEESIPERAEGEPSDEEFDISDEKAPAPKKKTRVIAAVLAVLVVIAMVLALVQPFGMARGSVKEGLFYEATGIPADAVLMKVDGVSITAERYFYWLSSACNAVSYYMESGTSFTNELSEGQTYADFCREYALGSVQEYVAIEKWAEEFGWTLSEEETAAMEDEVASYEEQYGDFIFNYWGFSRDTMRYLYTMNTYYQKAQEAAVTPGSELYPTEEEIAAYRETNDYMKADQIFLFTIDPETGDALSDAEKAEAKAKMEALRAEIMASSDIEATFTTLADENSEDTGRAYYPDGYVFNDDSGFVTEFTDAAKSIAAGEVSEIVESSMGYHLLLRKELTDEELLSNGTYFTDLLDGITAAQTVKYSKTFNDQVADMSIDTFNSAVNILRETMLSEFQSQQIAETDGSEESEAEEGTADGETTED